jgi:hypothetical protein
LSDEPRENLTNRCSCSVTLNKSHVRAIVKAGHRTGSPPQVFVGVRTGMRDSRRSAIAVASSGLDHRLNGVSISGCVTESFDKQCIDGLKHLSVGHHQQEEIESANLLREHSR